MKKKHLKHIAFDHQGKNNMIVTLHRSEFMRQFLLYGHVLSTEEAELYADYELKKNPPSLDNFKEQVCILLSHNLVHAM